VRAEGQARVGLVAVDRSVFILAENRLNLQQVFDELERLYMAPQVELHEARWYDPIATKGAADVIGEISVSCLKHSGGPMQPKGVSPRPPLHRPQCPRMQAAWRR